MFPRSFYSHPTKKADSSHFHFTILQFNVLAKKYATRDHWAFPKVSIETLDWDFRKNLIKEEVFRLDPDVICLEEVDQPQFFQEVLGFEGYEVIFHRSSEEKTGCLLAFRTNKFKLDWSERLNFSNGTGQVAIICHLKTLEDQSKELCFAVTHLKAKKGFEEVRKRQTEEILESMNAELDSLAQTPVIICGDFNDTPASDMFQVLKQGGFVSAYENYSEFSGGQELWTTFKVRPVDEQTAESGFVEIRRTIDYIFFNPKVEVTELLEIPQQLKETYKDVGLPCPEYPSDHLCISAKLCVKF